MSESAKRSVTKVGTVTSDKMNKSVVVRVDRTVQDKLYKRYVRRSAKFMAHDENNECRVGDTVEIVESRPLSARKRWRVKRILRRAVGVETTDAATADTAGQA
jgi:small subunit ribosomal protein S17